jgi:hypothetical protein
VKQWLRARDVVWPLAATKAEVDAEATRVVAERKRALDGGISAEFRKKYGLDSKVPPR